jgi:Uma2 family endonuclease
VLSPSTESYDRGAKWGHYQQIPSLREYLLVSGDPPRVERFFRGDDGVWRYESATSGTVRLSACAAALAFEDVFADLPEE